MIMVKTHVDEKMDETIPGLIPLFSANINVYIVETLIRSSMIPLAHMPLNLSH